MVVEINKALLTLVTSCNSRTTLVMTIMSTGEGIVIEIGIIVIVVLLQ